MIRNNSSYITELEDDDIIDEIISYITRYCVRICMTETRIKSYNEEKLKSLFALEFIMKPLDNLPSIFNHSTTKYQNDIIKKRFRLMKAKNNFPKNFF